MRRLHRAQRRSPELGQASKVEIRLIRNDAIATELCCFCEARPDDDAARFGIGQLLLISGVANKAYLAWSSRLQGGQTGDLQVCIAVQLPAQGGDDGGQAQIRHTCSTKPAYLAAATLSIFSTFSVISCLELL